MSRLTRDGTPEPVSRYQILRHERGQGNIHFSCSADHVQDWQPYYPVDPCVCVFSSRSFWTSSSLDVPAEVTQEEGHTGFLIHLLSAVRALNFSRKKDSAVPFPPRLWSRILCTKDLIVLHPLGIFSLFFSFLVRKYSCYMFDYTCTYMLYLYVFTFIGYHQRNLFEEY